MTLAICNVTRVIDGAEVVRFAVVDTAASDRLVADFTDRVVAEQWVEACGPTPSDVDILTWREAAARYLRAAWKHINGGKELKRLPEGIPSEARRMLDAAVGLFRRARGGKGVA